MEGLLLRFFLGAFCFFLSSSSVSGLQCYKCRKLDFKTSSSLAQTILNPILKSSNNYCSESVDQDTPGVEVDNCAMGAKCLYTKGTASISLAGITIEGSFYDRGCHKGDSSRDICQDHVKHSSVLDGVLGFFASVASYDGTTCTCSSDFCNSQTTRLPSTTLIWSLGLLFSLLMKYIY